MYYTLEGKTPVPCHDVAAWARWFEATRKGDGRRVAYGNVGPGVAISTVFLGIDHSFGDGPPLLFETMIFAPDEVYCERCSTWEQAEAQHQKAYEFAARSYAAVPEAFR